jgi:threonine/homoserine/homoserine lactone efflux protein
MHELIFLGSLAAVYWPLLASPGPNFLVLTRIAANDSRRHGVAASLGISSASTLYATLAVTGVGLLLAHSPRLQLAMQLAGGGYLLFKGTAMIRGSAAPRAAGRANSLRQSVPQAYREGLLTNLTNPQGLVFFASVFASLMPAGLEPWAKPAAVALVGASSISVNLATVVLFSSAAVQRHYVRAKTWIDCVAGCLLGGFGISLLRAVWR